jgi:gluconokinase
MIATILAIDIGTSSTRAILYDAYSLAEIDGASFAIDHEPEQDESGRSTLDPEQLVREVVQCAGTVLASAGSAVTVLAVGVSALWHSFTGVDAAGKPQTPVLLWSDRRSAPQVETLRHVLNTDVYTQRTGCPLHSSYPPGRLLWLQETSPQIWNHCHRFLSPPEYLFSRLFGLERTTVSHSMASGTGLLHQSAGAWDTQTLTFVPGLAPGLLSPISDSPVSGCCRNFVRSCPRLRMFPGIPH